MDRNRPKNEQKLLEWVRPHLSDAKKFRLILDPRLEGKYHIKSAQKLAAIANRCLIRQAKSRPKMSEILEMVNLVVDSMDTGSPQLPMKILAPNDRSGISRREQLKRRLAHPIIRDNSCFQLITWRRKVLETC